MFTLRHAAFMFGTTSQLRDSAAPFRTRVVVGMKATSKEHRGIPPPRPEDTLFGVVPS
jgi:hypothetical protein